MSTLNPQASGTPDLSRPKEKCVAFDNLEEEMKHECPWGFGILVATASGFAVWF